MTLGRLRELVGDPGRVAVVLVAFAPLALIPGGFDRFAAPKLAVAALALTVGAWAPASGRVPRQLLIVGSVIAVIMVMAASASAAPDGAWWGRYPRYEGLPAWLVYGGSAWLGARLVPAYRRTLEAALACSVIVLAVASVLERAGHSPIDTAGVTRPGSLLGNATDQGLVAMVVVAFLLPPLLRERAWLPGVGVGAGIVVIALSESRAAMVGLLVAAGVVAVASRRTRTSLLTLGATAVALVLLVLALPATRDRLLSGHTVSGRWLLWQETLHLIGAHPLLGVGPSGFVEAIRARHDAIWVAHVGVANPPDSPHNWILQTLVVGGIPLVIAVVVGGVLAVRAVVDGLRDDPLRWGAAVAVLAYVVALLTHFTSPGTTPLAAFLAGGAVAVPVAASPRAAQAAGARWSRIASVPLAALALLWGAASIGERETAHAVRLAASGDVAGAASSLSAAQHWRPWDPDVAMLGAQTLAAGAGDGDPAAAPVAEEWARRALRRLPTSYDARLALGVALLQQGDLDAALAELDRAVAQAPTEPQARIQRALARFGTRDVAGARVDLQVAQRLDPADPVPGRILDQIAQRGL